jgi:hypothetical protein
MPGEPEIIGITLERKPGDIIWDKNLVNLIATVDGKEIGRYEFGLMGQRPFMMYGPYWHAWRVDENEICPFKNDELITHPCNVDCGMVLSNNYAYLDREYLDEKALAAGPLPEEGPDMITANRDWFWTGEKIGYVGERVYYFVKEIVTSKDTEPVVARIGCDSPIEVWMDGVKVATNAEVSSWTYNDIRIDTQFYADKPIRMVIKMARKQDDARLSFCVIKQDVPGDKMKGDSYLIDSLGSRIIEG